MVHRRCLDPTDGLDARAGAAYERDGVLVIEGFASADACDGLRQRTLAIAAEHAPHAPGTVLLTRDQRHAKDAYFEASANRIGAFFEEGAFDADGTLQVPLDRAVNKLGRAMHDLDPMFIAFSRDPALQAVADGVDLTDPKLLQSMYIVKQPGIGDEVMCHQDSTYLYTRPDSVVSFWSRSRMRIAATAVRAGSPASIARA